MLTATVNRQYLKMKGKICSVCEINDTSVTAIEAQKRPLWRNAALSVLFILQARDFFLFVARSPPEQQHGIPSNLRNHFVPHQNED